MSQPDHVHAEVEASAGREYAAASALQRLGFRVLRIDKTISVAAPAQLWRTTFGVSFEEETRDVLRHVPGGTTRFLRADKDRMTIPSELRDLVVDIYFAEPPDLY